MEEYVRDNLWAVLVEEILLIYKKIIEHVTFTLITTNHYFGENPEKARAARLKEAEEVLQITPTFGFDPPTKVVDFASGCTWSFGTVVISYLPAFSAKRRKQPD
jgi:hypothetical protein